MVTGLVVSVALVAAQFGHARADRIAADLAREAEGLVVRSETDAPLAAIACPCGGEAPATADTVLREFGFDPDTPVRVRSVRAFFKSQTSAREWHSPDEAARARRFRRLVDRLLHDLRDVRVFEVGTRVKHVFVLGVAAPGECAGVRTLVVET